MEDKIVEIFTDGACSGNPGPGGWAAILRYGRHQKEISGYSPYTTNNRMELLAAIRALEALKRPCKVILYSDSRYLKDGITKWMENWKKNGWARARNKSVKNMDLWMILDELASNHDIQWKWVRGHSGHEENELVDSLARMAIKAGNKGQMKEDPLGRQDDVNQVKERLLPL